MMCEKCHGLMIVQILACPEGEEPCLRCLNCGRYLFLEPASPLTDPPTSVNVGRHEVVQME